MDNMVWLGTRVGHLHAWLAGIAVACVPLFAWVAAFFAEQCAQHGWVLLLAAGMAAWAGCGLVLQAPPPWAITSSVLWRTWMAWLQAIPPTALQAELSALAVAVGVALRRVRA